MVLSFPSPEDLHHEQQLDALDDEQLIDQVDQQFGGVPENIRGDAEAQQFFIPGLRFDIALLAGYEHQVDGESIDVATTAICGTDDSAVDLADMHGWGRMTKAGFRLRSMPGDHFFPLERIPEVLQVAAWDVLPG